MRETIFWVCWGGFWLVVLVGTWVSGRPLPSWLIVLAAIFGARPAKRAFDESVAAADEYMGESPSRERD